MTNTQIFWANVGIKAGLFFLLCAVVAGLAVNVHDAVAVGVLAALAEVLVAAFSTKFGGDPLSGNFVKENKDGCDK